MLKCDYYTFFKAYSSLNSSARIILWNNYRSYLKKHKSISNTYQLPRLSLLYTFTLEYYKITNTQIYKKFSTLRSLSRLSYSNIISNFQNITYIHIIYISNCKSSDFEIGQKI